MTFTDLTIAQVAAGIHDVAEDARMTFGSLDDRQLNWRPDENRWSIAQCFDHLVTSNNLVRAQATSALEHPPSTVWQRLPLWSGFFGRALITSQGPTGARKFKASPKATPPSRISPDIIQRFVDQHRELEAWARGLDEGKARRSIMISPFARMITYSVLDGLRLLVAHDRRHFEQARRVLQELPKQ